MQIIQKYISNNLRANVLNGFNQQMSQFQVSSAYIKGVMAKNGSTYPVPSYLEMNMQIYDLKLVVQTQTILPNFR